MSAGTVHARAVEGRAARPSQGGGRAPQRMSVRRRVEMELCRQDEAHGAEQGQIDACHRGAASRHAEKRITATTAGAMPVEDGAQGRQRAPALVEEREEEHHAEAGQDEGPRRRGALRAARRGCGR